MGLRVEKQKSLPLTSEEIRNRLPMDILVKTKVIIELKAVEILNDVQLARVLTYLKLSNGKLNWEY